MNTVDIAGITLYNVHADYTCEGRPCVIHNPVSTHMDGWPLHYRTDRNIFERMCECGIGHPDPSQFDYWADTRQEWQATHGCCGHCHE